MDHYSHQFVYRVSDILLVVGRFQFEFEGKGNLPNKFGDSSLYFIVLESSKMDG